MKGTSKLIMGATLAMVVTLAVVLGLILMLLAELYCSLLLRRRRLRKANSNTFPATETTTTIISATSSPSPSHPQQHSPPPPPPPFSTIYAQGVLQPPRTFLFPSTKEDKAEPKKQQNSDELHQIIEIQTVELTEIPVQGEHLVYISNPIYENEDGKGNNDNNTPFETPNTSPSRLELEESDSSSYSGEDEDEAAFHYTPPLTPMKKLPAEACSVSLRDATSLDTSASDSHSVNGPSSSSSASPCTSPSW